MFAWLNGPGAVFKQPLPGSTNYLNAYDTLGNLVRAPNASIPGRAGNKMPGNAPKIEEDSKDNEDAEESANVPPERRKSHKLLQEQAKAAARDEGLPTETQEDLMPFPLNRSFRSEPVLSDELKDEIYRRIMEEKRSVRDVSTALGVEMKRIGAVVRLKALEKQWEQEGKVLATPYARAVMSMLPKTPYIPNDPIPHESINDLPVHYSTRQQIFHPVSESRHFTRRDAAKVFDSTLLPAEDRIPHPELYEMQKWKQEGMVPAERIARRRAINEEEIDRQQTAQKAREEKENTTIKRSLTPRWEFRFQDFNSEEVGKNERSAKGVGSRYGLPLQDRKKGQIKIPTKVEV